jgi:hypothetical protein
MKDKKDKKAITLRRGKVFMLLIISLFIFNSMGGVLYAADRLIPISGAVLNDQLNFKLNNATVIPVGDDGTPVLPISYNGTTYLPVRAIGYLLNLGIDYEAATKTVLITSTSTKKAPVAQDIKKSNTLISINNTVLNEQLKFKLDGISVVPVGDDGTPVLPISYNGTTYLPVRAIGYLLKLGVDWDGGTRTVLLDSTEAIAVNTDVTAKKWVLVDVFVTDWQAKIDAFNKEKPGQLLTYNYVDNSNTGIHTIKATQTFYNNGDPLSHGGTFTWADPPKTIIPYEAFKVNVTAIQDFSWNPNQTSVGMLHIQKVYLNEEDMTVSSGHSWKNKDNNGAHSAYVDGTNINGIQQGGELIGEIDISSAPKDGYRLAIRVTVYLVGNPLEMFYVYEYK